MGIIIEFKNYREFLKAEEKVIWRYLAYRDFSPLLASLMIRGVAVKKCYKKLFDFNYAWSAHKGIKDYWFSNPQNITKIQKIGEKISLPEIKRAVNECYKQGERMLARSEKIRRKDLSHIQSTELFAMLKSYRDDILKFSVFIVYPMYAFEQPFENKIREFLKRNEWKNIDEAVGILTYPVKKNFAYWEQHDFLSLAAKIKKDKKLKNIFQKKTPTQAIKELKKYPEALKRIKEHIYEYGWLQCRNYYGKEWSLAEMAQRIKTALPTAENDFKELLQVEKKINSDYRKLVKTLRIKSGMLKIIEMSKELVYYRTYRTDIFYKSGYNIRNLLTEIGKRFGYDFSDIINMRIEEIMSLPKNKISKEALRQRKKGFAMVMVGGKMNWFWGSDMDRYRKELKEFKKSQKKQAEIKGNTANKGVVRGAAKIVKTVDDLPKVKKGDILVAPMTFPSFIPAMEKAAAFVTNEGGILCHAAIVSREMNKPCVINAKNATEVLRDGDLVEVDADEGVVRVVKAANKQK